MSSEPPVHVFLVSFPFQGHVNPLLRLGKRLASMGLLVTFSTMETIGREIRKLNPDTHDPTPVGDGFIRFEFMDDGWDENDPRRFDLDVYMSRLELVGKETLPKLLKKHADEARPVSCLINNPFIPWVSDVAESAGIPNAVLWVQSTACFSAYYHYYHSIVPFPTVNDPEIDVKLPGMPLLKHDEIPSFLHPKTEWPFLGRAILGQFRNLNIPFCVLVETFQELEPETIEYMSKICPVKPVGPLFKLATESEIRGDFMKADDCIGWLDTKPPSSAVYISFGSVVSLKQDQFNEIAEALLTAKIPFLWVVRPPVKDSGTESAVVPDGFPEKAGENGRIVQWAPQEQVLAHRSVACFVTHCGWNSTMEALTSGVPVVAFPQWGDQVTNAKYLVDVFMVGIRMCRGVAEGRVIPREEVVECFRAAVSGPKAAEMRENALKWKKAAEEAVAEGGSSYRNMQAFVDEIKSQSSIPSKFSSIIV